MTTSRKVSSNPDFVPPLQDPFPVPTISTTLFQKETPHEKLGITLRTYKSATCTVFVARIAADSPLLNNNNNNNNNVNVTEGSEILAVNGQAVHTASQAMELLAAYSKLEITTVHPTVTRNMPPFCYVQAAPTSRINPGVSFQGTCHDTMVMVGQVLVQEGTTRLRRGDLVLAVQGTAVGHVHDARVAQVAAARQGQAFIVYCIDMDELRRHVCIPQGLAYQPVPKDFNSNNNRVVDSIQQRNQDTWELRERDCIFQAIVDYNTQLLRDETPWNRRIKNIKDSKGMVLKQSYAMVCLPTAEYMNRCLLQQLQIIQMAVVSEAWKHAMQSNNRNHGGNVDATTTATNVVPVTAPAYTIPSAPSEHLILENTLTLLPQAQAFLVEDVE